ncbi:hypothetical protein PRIPAC_75395 [Pristionchus pacificus]|uniref:Uncharacterized protein n=1 Tax=Pristionchus pacificus TaxID=54126 RepID=A0A2A6CFM9_PRIPA|nr:hypothetical protein PRIPAC_75395 [Pristionchus pacificus]|eukprot:PDM76916.1 hypothetical protein PRIPAC_42311 [Pristionchus pacificus]
MIILLLFSISILFVGCRGHCYGIDFNFHTDLENFHVPYGIYFPSRDGNLITNCEEFNTENLTYILKVRHKGDIKDVDSFGCNYRTYYYTVNGTSVNYNNQQEVTYYCAVPIDRACENPKMYCSGNYCPQFTQGSDKSAAKLECPEDRWVISNEEYTLKPVCQAGPRKYTDPGFFVILKNEKGIYLDKYDRQSKFACKLNTTPIPEEKQPERPTKKPETVTEGERGSAYKIDNGPAADAAAILHQVIILLLFSISTPFVGCQADRCYESDFHFKSELDDFHVPYGTYMPKMVDSKMVTNCDKFNKGKFTYSLKARYNVVLKDVESFGCNEDHRIFHSSFFYRVNGMRHARYSDDAPKRLAPINKIIYPSRNHPLATLIFYGYNNVGDVQYYCAIPA